MEIGLESKKNLDLKKLSDFFPEDDIEWRVGQSGIYNGKIWVKCLAYVTNRAIMDRLDEICGAGNWKNEYVEWHNTSQLCGISLRLNNEWVTKWDGADNTNIEGTKGGLSDSMKRAAVQWGIGRYLYKMPDSYGIVFSDRSGKYKAKVKDNNKDVWFTWNPPKMPDNFILKTSNNQGQDWEKNKAVYSDMMKILNTTEDGIQIFAEKEKTDHLQKLNAIKANLQALQDYHVTLQDIAMRRIKGMEV